MATVRPVARSDRRAPHWLAGDQEAPIDHGDAVASDQLGLHLSLGPASVARTTTYRARVDGLLDRAMALVGQDDEEAVRWARVAADVAWHHHTGRFVTPFLEELLIDVGRSAVPSVDLPSVGGGIVHVLTEGYATGGHTRLVARWIDAQGSVAHVVHTSPGAGRIPELLADSVARSGGSSIGADGGGGLLHTAGRLRSLVVDAEAVVLHTHPWDVVPSLAFAHDGGPPVVMVAHTDNVHLVGHEIADRLVTLRRAATEVATTRRGIPPERIVEVPIPVPDPERELSQAQARAELGLDDDLEMILTVGPYYKYIGDGVIDFVDLVEPILRDRPRAVLVAVGPPLHGRFEELHQMTGGRVIACGPRLDLATFFAAADVYVESHAITGITATLEAASHGLPVVTFTPPDRLVPVLDSDSPGLDGLSRHPTPE
ncbi:MAG: glycosyltransferase, partial [Actinomycetota bacterium]